MNDITVMVVDDAPGMRLVLKKVIDKTDGFVSVCECECGEDAVKMYEKHKPQLVFMDVEMGEMSGIDCARELTDRDPSLIIIFATAHQEYMIDAFKLYAFDYLLKPFDIDRLYETLERVKVTIKHRTGELLPQNITYKHNLGLNKIMLRRKEGVSVVNMADILLVQREDRSTVIYTANDRLTINDSLGELYAKLDNRMFLRCHKSYIINISAITTIYPYGRWTYIAKLKGIEQDALITHDKLGELEKIFS